MTELDNKKNNLPVMIGLGVLALAAIGGVAYMSKQLDDAESVQEDSEQVQVAEQELDQKDELPAIVPGNPVVAKIGDVEIFRSDVANYIRSLPAHLQQMPIDSIFPMAVDQIVNEKLVRLRAAKANMDDNKLVQERVANAKKEIVATVFLQEAIATKLTDELVQKAYDDYVGNFKNVEEVRASHILVDDKDLAVEIIQKLENGANFAELAKEYSTDTVSAQNGGDLGFFSKEDVVPEFAEAAFGLNVGDHTFQPVKSQFGYHIIERVETRTRPTPTLAEVRPMLEGELRQVAMQELFIDWRSEQTVQVFDINGNPYPEVEETEAASEEPLVDTTK